MNQTWRTAAVCVVLALLAVPGIQLVLAGRRLLDDEALLGTGYLLCLAGAALTAIGVGNAVSIAVGAPTARFTGLILGVMVIPTSLWASAKADIGWVGVVGSVLGFLAVVLLAQKGVLGFAALRKPGVPLPPQPLRRDWTRPDDPPGF